MTGRRRGYPVGDARRERILYVALQEFAQNGYRGASLAKIAERAELSQPGLLHHFRTKADLLVAVLELRDQEDAVRFAPDTVADGDILEALVQLVEHNARVPGLVQLFTVVTSEAATDPDHPARIWAQARYRRTRKMITDELREGIDEGRVRPGIEAEEYADRLIAMMDGLQIQWLLEPDAVDMVEVFRGYVEELRHELRP